MNSVKIGVSFDMRAPDWGTPANELYRAAIEMAAFADAIGARPDRERMLAALDLAAAVLADAVGDAPAERQLRIIAAHAEIARLRAQAPTYNFDPGLLAMEIGGLLASAAVPRQATTAA